MAQTMSKDEYLAFLSAGTRTGKLATAGRDGRPHVAPIWFILDGETLVFTTGRDTVKGRRIRRDPRVALVVDDETPPYAYVLVEGTVETSLCPPDMLDWTTRIGARYMGADRANEYGQRNAAPEELLVRLTPTKVIATKGVAD